MSWIAWLTLCEGFSSGGHHSEAMGLLQQDSGAFQDLLTGI